MYKPVRSSFNPFLTPTLLLSIFLVFIQPAWAEDFNFPGLSGTVTVTEDQYGIPTIKGESQLDVIFVQGYMQARDRFFQMDTTRKGIAGRAAEMFGESVLASDVQLRTLGMGRAATTTWMALDADSKGWLQAFSNGVNTWLANNPLPPEYVGLEITKVDPWTPLDCVLVAKALAASFSLGLDDLDSSITLGTYVAVGDVVGFDGQALYFEDTHRSAPPDDRVTDPTFLAGPGPGESAQSTAAATGKSGKEKSRIEYIGDRTVSEKTLLLEKNFRYNMDIAPQLNI
jgi:penicillin amidase